MTHTDDAVEHLRALRIKARSDLATIEKMLAVAENRNGKPEKRSMKLATPKPKQNRNWDPKEESVERVRSALREGKVADAGVDGLPGFAVKSVEAAVKLSHSTIGGVLERLRRDGEIEFVGMGRMPRAPKPSRIYRQVGEVNNGNS
jgi:hypothetical protein